MSHIDRVDLGNRYDYAAGVMSSHLEGLTKGELESGKSIPMSTLLVVRELFDEPLALIEYDRGKESIPEHVPRAVTINFLVNHVLQIAKGNKYKPNREFEKDLRLCSELLHELPNKIRRNLKEYEILQRFFHHLHQTSGEWTYDRFLSGESSPYAYSL